MKLKRFNISDAVYYKIAFVLSLSTLSFLTSLYLQQLKKVNYAQEQLIGSRERQMELSTLISHIKDAESMQRAFLLSGDSIYFNAFIAGKHKTNQSLKRLKSLSNNNYSRNKDLHKLGRLIWKRFKIMESVAQGAAKLSSKTTFKQQLKEGYNVMKSVNSLANIIFLKENAALKKYEAIHNKDNRFLPYFTALFVLFCIVVLIYSFYKLNRYNKRIHKMNRDLLLTNRSFEYAEKMSGMGHWKRNLATLEIEPSDNMYRLFGLEPGAVPYTEETLQQFVHPDDRTLFMDSIARMKQTREAPNLIYRIIRKDGALRYFKTSARIFDSEDVPIVLGSTSDITQQVEAQQHIEQKNKKLEDMVHELASFNHAASHDLQEPLRKIQVFISRILNEEGEKFSDAGRDYFNRISSSAERMEMLIDDLLLYSETGKEGHVFETTDLNTIFHDAQVELSAEIEAKNAAIHTDKLPPLPVIPFQVRQLFINLISNALKYSKPDIAPVITVSYKKTKVPAGGSSKTWHEIAVSDNGIGFPQEYAEKIFELFHRLHNKTKYSGTGIGLAICKKIMENHNGAITAESSPGEGATFRICFPK